jgi:uncharacterized RmlC-like cupin family protein
MAVDTEPTCRVFRGGETYPGKQGFAYTNGISAESAGARGLCMVLLTIQPGDRAKAHLHEDHETAIYVVSGESVMWYGDRLQHHMVVGEGDMLYIPAGVRTCRPTCPIGPASRSSPAPTRTSRRASCCFRTSSATASRSPTGTGRSR